MADWYAQNLTPMLPTGSRGLGARPASAARILAQTAFHCLYANIYRLNQKGNRAECCEDTSTNSRRGTSETAHRALLIRLHIEDREQSRNLQNVVHALGQMHELQLAFGAAHRRIGGHHLTDA